MSVSAIIDYIISTIVTSRCGIASYCCTFSDDTSAVISVKLSKTADVYNNLHVLRTIETALCPLICANAYALSNIVKTPHLSSTYIHFTLRAKPPLKK